MKEPSHCSRNWTLKRRTLFALGLMGSGTLFIVFLVFGWPVVFWPGLWKGYTCWEDDLPCQQ